VTLEIWQGEELLVIKDVVADVCQQCGEAYISAQMSERFDHSLSEHQRHRPERYIAVPQYSAAQSLVSVDPELLPLDHSPAA